jgi:hypothetical protein
VPDDQPLLEAQAVRVYDILAGLGMRLSQEQVDQRAVVIALTMYLGRLVGYLADEGKLQIALASVEERLRANALEMVSVAGHG